MNKKNSTENLHSLEIIDQSKVATDWSALLSALAITKDKTSYLLLYQHFAPKVKAYIMRLGLVESCAEELMQETMLAVWRKAYLYYAAKAVASTWIFTLARNKSIDWMRKQKYPQYSLDDWQEEPDEASENSLEVGEQMVTSNRMEKVISQLPEQQRQVIFMSFYEGRSHSEIANRLGIPLGSVKSRIRLASAKIKMIWGVK